MSEFTKDEVAKAKQLVKEVYQEDGARAKRLRAKCRWEQMTPIAVMLDWLTLFDGLKSRAIWKL